MTDILATLGLEGGEAGGEAVSGVSRPEDEFEVDDSLPLPDKIQKYLQSDMIIHRLYLVRELAGYAHVLGTAETQVVVVPVLNELKQDVEPVIRQALVEQLPLVAESLSDESGQQCLISSILPIAVQLTRDANPQVRLSTTEALIGLATPMDVKTIEQHILPVVSSLANDSSQEEYRVEAARLVQHLAKHMGKELCIEFALPLMIKLASDNFRIRKVIGSNIGPLATVVGTEIATTQLLPLYQKLVSDEIWGVRKACAESIVALSSVLSPQDRTAHLVSVFSKLAEDQSRWVRSTSFEGLGHFIATFEGTEVDPKLVKYFTGMAGEPGAKYADSELVAFCAFDFPAVLYTIGGARWPEVKETYIKLSTDLQWKVRRPLAYSLHEVAKLIGKEATKTDLLPLFEALLKDLDEVKVGVVRNLASFMALLEDDTREQYFSLISDITSETSNWRFRRYIARQMGALSDLYSPALVKESLVPVSLILCQDPVAAVRTAAHSQMGRVINRLARAEALQSDFLNQIVGLGVSSPESSYIDRQIFVHICGGVVADVSVQDFATTFLPTLLPLVTDRVPNVRIGVAQVFATMATLPAYKDNEIVSKQLAILAEDHDRDVVYFAKGLGTTPPQQ